MHIHVCVSEYGKHALIHKSLSAVFVPGDFDVVNFRDVIAESDINLGDNTALFEFEFDPMTRLSASPYALRLTWSQVSGPSSGEIEAKAECRYYRQRNAQVEQVGHTGTYRLYVPLRLLGDGRLLVNLTINMSCSNNRYRYRCDCYDWLVRGTSDSLEISAKRG